MIHTILRQVVKETLLARLVVCLCVCCLFLMKETKRCKRFRRSEDGRRRVARGQCLGRLLWVDHVLWVLSGEVRYQTLQGLYLALDGCAVGD